MALAIPVGNTLRVLATNLHSPDGIEDANTLVGTALTNAFYATRSTYHSGRKVLPEVSSLLVKWSSIYH